MTVTRLSSTQHVFTLRASLSESAQVRAFLRPLAAELGISPERTFDIQVAVGEAVANAIEHAHGFGEVRVEVNILSDRLEVSVQGMGDFHLPATGDGREHRGLGLPLMAALSDHLALYSRPDGGTLVTLTFYLPGSRGPQSSLPPSLVELLAQHSLLEEVLASVSDSFIVYDEAWRAVYLNDRAAERLGRPREELLGEVVWERLPDLVERPCHEEWHRAVRERRRVTYEEYDAPLDRWFEDGAFPFAGGLAVFSRDITKRKRAELGILHSEERYRSLFANMVEGFAYCRMLFADDQPVDFEYLAVNEAFASLTGLREVVGQRVTEVIPGIRDTNPAVFEIYGRVSLTGVPEHFEDYFPALDSWLSVSVYSVERGTFVAVFENITERKRAEEALRANEEQLRVAALAGDVGLWSWVPGTSTVTVSANWRRLFGVAPDEEVALETWVGRLHPEDRERAVAELNAAADEHREFDTEYRVIWPDGTVRWLVDRGRASYDEEGRPVHMAGVNVDLTARKRAEEALRESEERFRTMADAIPQLAWIANADGFIYWYNQRWYDYTGTTLSEMEGWGWQSVHDPAELPQVLERWNDSIGTGQPFDMEFPLRGADGVFRPFLTRVMPLKDAEGRVLQWFGTNTDLTERKRAEEALRASQERARRQLETILSPHGDLGLLELGDIIDVPAVQSLMDHFYALAHIPMSVVDRQGKVLVGEGWQDICTKFHRVHPETCAHCLESDTQLSAGVPLGEYRLYKCKNGMWDIATPIVVAGEHLGNVFSGQFFFADEELDYALFRAQARRYGFDERMYMDALEAAPRLTRGAVETGVQFLVELATMLSQLGYSNLKLARAEREGERLLGEVQKAAEELHAQNEELAVQAGELRVQTEEAAKLLDERERREAELLRLNRTLHALGNSKQALTQATDEASYLHEVCRILAEDCGHAMVWIGYAEQDEAKTVRPVAHWGFDAGYLETLKVTWADCERGRGPTGTAIRTGKPSACRDMLTDPRFAPWREEAIKRSYASSLALPLLENGRAMGAVTIYSSKPDAFSKAEVNLLTELAGDLAYGIAAVRLRAAHARAQVERERLLAVAETELRRSKVLNEVATACAGSLDLREIAEKVLAAVREHLGTTRASIYLLDRSPEVLRRLAYLGYSEDEARLYREVPFGRESSVWRMLASSEAPLTHESAHESRARDQLGSAIGLNSGSWALLPIRVGDRDLGILALAFAESPSFVEAQLTLFRSIAAQLATAMDNARLYQRTSSVAETLQEALVFLPSVVPGVRFGHAYRSATEAARLGGDFFDVFALPSGQVGIIVGDVSGKGVEAAYLASFTRESVRAFALHNVSPRHILRLANEALIHRHGRKHFVTAVLVLLDPTTGKLKYALAGHPPPVVVSPQGAQLARWKGAPPLGVFEDARYHTATYTLDREATLVFYTDGITEARRNGELLGEAGLTTLVNHLRFEVPDVIAEQVLAEVADYGGGTFRDDAAVLAVKLA